MDVEARKPLGNVVVCTDFTRHAHDAVARAARLPLAPGSRITLLHVQPPGLPPDLGARLHATAGALLSGSIATVAAEAERAEVSGVDVFTSIETGYPAECAARLARDTSADLLVVGRGERRGLAERVMGSTAERIARSSELSVLIVGSGPEGPYRHPLVPVDLSALSRRGVELALRLISAEVTSVDVAHAYEAAYLGLLALGGLTPRELDTQLAAAETSARTLLAGWIPEAKAAGVTLNAILRRGDARRVILHEIAERGSDLVVVGRAAHSTLGQLLIGSVAQSVMRSAPCDVLVVC